MIEGARNHDSYNTEFQRIRYRSSPLKQIDQLTFEIVF